jgi:TrmH family RNA methyltransferase
MPRPIDVTSPKNPIVHRFRDAAVGEIPGELVVDGNKLVEEALDARLEILAAAFSDKLLKARNGHDMKRRLEQRAAEVYVCSEGVIERMSSLSTPQGVIAIVRSPLSKPGDLLGADPSRALVVAAAGVRDPGNLGAMVRATEAAGGTGCIAMLGGADPFRDKAVRGSSGSVLRLPILTRIDGPALAAFAKEHGLQLLVADQRAEAEYLDADWTRPTVVALGNEGAGVPDEVRELADLAVRIPIQPTIDSLNVAVAAGVLLYEARRQRR